MLQAAVPCVALHVITFDGHARRQQVPQFSPGASVLRLRQKAEIKKICL